MTASATPTTTATEVSPPGVAALQQRLQAAATALGVVPDVSGADPALGASEVYGRLVEHVHRSGGRAELWLLLTALTAAMPDLDHLEAAVRARDLHDASGLAAWLLEAGWAPAASAAAMDLEMDVITDGVVVDVDFSARHELHTGIQRVVRETSSRWSGRHDFLLVAWTGAAGAFRQLTPVETDRVLHFHERDEQERRATLPEGSTPRLVVPWRSSVLLLENPSPDQSPVVAALGAYSGNRVALVGYDLIPAISPELIHPGLPDRFMRYLVAVKHAQRVVAISHAAGQEFRGFARMVGAQGLAGPEVGEVVLPVEVPAGTAASTDGRPLVVCVGSFEPRKNQLAVLHAAEQLWREGLDFRLQFIGGGGWTTEFDAVLTRLRRRGRPVERRTAIPDAELWSTLRSATFTVFLSLHEGFGLPVAESLACGVPCLTSDRGATAEVAAAGGALVVDPLDDVAVADQMRRLLTDSGLRDQLRAQAAARPLRTWDAYADELWDAMTAAPQPTDPSTEQTR